MPPTCLSVYAISALPHSLSRRDSLDYCRHASRFMQCPRCRIPSPAGTAWITADLALGLFNIYAPPHSLSCQERVRVRYASDFAWFDGQPCLTHSPITTRR